MFLCHKFYLKMRVGSGNKICQEPQAVRDGSRKTGPSADPKSTEDLRPHISAISVRPFQQEKERGPRWGAYS